MKKETKHSGDEAETDEETKAFNRRFKYALIGFAIVEFVVLASVIYYKSRR
ncbi:MAG TPA: hypothetical protein VNA19_07815 [Pyrinomonadaceae bacterium]|jgi:hypothetical protein|nr:hypothetical protein [Pyrinomonadaceae bacterium]